jgi:pimeloyl-ACP methyl ester carboxylesterase
MVVQEVFIYAVVFIVTIMAVGVAAGQIQKARLISKYTEIGRLVDIGGYRLHFHCMGQGGPSVILDAGQGQSSLSWDAIQREIAKTTQVCAYDRAGLGWSDPGFRPRTAHVMAEELHQLLEAAGIPKPYILVGASLGGLNVRVFAHIYPQEVAGLVLLDAAHEEQYLPEAIRKALKQMAGMMSLMGGYSELVVRSGIAALFPRLLPGGSSASLAAQTDQALRVARPAYMQASIQEINDVQQSHAEVREMGVSNLGDIPVLVVRHGKVQTQMMPEVTEVMEETNQRLQAKVAGQSPKGRLVVAEESGHAIQVDQPDLVIETILEVIAIVREQSQVGESCSLQARMPGMDRADCARNYRLALT